MAEAWENFVMEDKFKPTRARRQKTAKYDMKSVNSLEAAAQEEINPAPKAAIRLKKLTIKLQFYTILLSYCLILSILKVHPCKSDKFLEVQ